MTAPDRLHRLFRAHRAAQILVLVAVCLSGLASQAASSAPNDGFIRIFDGKSFQGWKAPEMSWWSIEDGAITGRITPEHPCTTNQYLVWTGGDLADFELKLESRLSGNGGINNGFQFRSRVLPDGDVAGYQMDNNLQTDWLVRLYDEFGRHTLAWRGKDTVFDSAGKATTVELPEGAGPAWFKLEDWHEYHLTCIGSKLELRVNGRLAARVDDHDPRRFDPQGVLALQLHSGPPTKVQFRNIQLRILKPAAAPARLPRERRRTAILEDALVRWDFGVGGHQPGHALRYVGSLDDVEFNVRAVGPGAIDGARAALLRGGYFEALNPIPASAKSFTLFLRGRTTKEAWDGVLFDAMRPGTDQGLRLTANGGTLEVEWNTDRQQMRAQAGIPTSSDGPWVNLAARWDGRQLEILRDGARAASVECDHSALSVGAEWIRMGADVANGKARHAFVGELEEIALWNQALSDRDVAVLMRTRSLGRRP
ncbi:MAG: DUF1080 domain-containing protein [Verrucomicrobiales bacterium]|nr:DUF1080 domain-containing protein [Verrucomicrobiales bacterium]